VIRFLHLSDIHFTIKQSGLGYEPDKNIRNEVLRDVRRLVQQRGAITAIIVSGDIAYAGKRSEYEDAALWLDELCSAAGCTSSAVYLCPGNHDIDQAVLKENDAIGDIHDSIRNVENDAERDQALFKRLRQPAVARMLYSPLEAYNEFAARYESSFLPDVHQFILDHPFLLNDGSTLCLRAVNSALISGLSDNVRTLMLGMSAFTFQRMDGVEYAVMSHHPPSWLIDGNSAESSFNVKCRLQLFGHEHDQRVHLAKEFVRLSAGSINPHRQEPNWRPGFNWIEISISATEGRRHMHIDVLPREWQRQNESFVPLVDANLSDTHSQVVVLPPWSAPVVAPAQQSTATAINAASATPTADDHMATQSVIPSEQQFDFRDLIYRFFRLSASHKNEITGQLGLASDDDSALADFDRNKRALIRAREHSLLSQLDAAIAQMERREYQ
jgi:hypothetical protein